MKEKLYQMIKDVAKKERKNIVIAEGWDERCLEATQTLLKENIVDITLLGIPNVIRAKAKELNLNIEKAKIVDFKNYDQLDKLIKHLVELRQHKGMTEEKAKELLKDENYFACTYVSLGYADALVGSKICPTGALMKPTLQILRQKGKLVSEVSVLYSPIKEKVYFTTDSSLNIDPDTEGLAQIALNAADAVKGIGIVPKVALISFSTHGSGGENSQTKKVKDALEIIKTRDTELIVDGELQVDAAVDSFAASRKCPESPLKGDANILVFPDLNSGNVFGHSMFQFSDIELMFTIATGLRKPVGILGRSTPTDFVINLIYAVAMEANVE